MDIFTQFTQLKAQLATILLQEWVKDTFSFRWWFEAITSVITYMIWWKLLDKRRIAEILLFGSLIAVMNMLLDMVAVLYNLWTYKVRLVPIMPSVFPFDLTFIPVVYMLGYQYFTPWRQYVWGGLLSAAAFSLVFFPLLVYLDIVEMQNWNFLYSLIAHCLEALVARTAIGLIYHVQFQATQQTAISAPNGFTGLHPAMKPCRDDEPDSE